MTVTTQQDQTVEAIRAHHQQLALAVAGGCVQVSDAAERLGDAGRFRDQLMTLLRGEILPHAAAEERTLYAAAADFEPTAMLVQAMIEEHRRLEGLVDDLAAARTPVAMASLATAVRALFEAHLVKENDILLPALVSEGVDLAGLLSGMHEILGAPEHTHAAVQENAGCGCGCGCGHADATATDTETSDLDVRSLPHALRHEQIFAAVNTLAPGEFFVLANDHDPKPLRFQFEAQAPGAIGWEYLAEGPDVWRVRITRN
jgi:uncharacterized protein (DUF2249 family)